MCTDRFYIAAPEDLGEKYENGGKAEFLVTNKLHDHSKKNYRVGER